MDRAFLDELRRIVGDDGLLQEPLELLTYECDALPHLRALPAAVVLPESAAQVQAVVGCARAKACRSCRVDMAPASPAARCRWPAAS